MAKIQSDFYCGDCDKDMEDVWAEVINGEAFWVCPECGDDKNGATELL